MFTLLITLVVIAATVVPIAIVFTRGGVLEALTGRNSAAFRDGLVGLGTVTGVRQTGLTVNDQPQLRIDLTVEGADGSTFDSSAKMIVPLTELALLRTGVVLPVRYLPGRTDRVEIDKSGDVAQAQNAMNEAMIRQGITTRGNLFIAVNGIAAQAVVQSLSVTGEIRNGHTKVDLGLTVTRPDGTTFKTQVEKFVAPTAVGHVQVGRIVQIHYLPENEQEVVIAIPVNT